MINGHFKASIDLYHNNLLQTSRCRFVSIRKDYIYISRNSGRVYWILNRVKKLPNIKINDKKMIFYISTYKIVFKKRKEFEYCIKMIGKYKCK